GNDAYRDLSCERVGRYPRRLGRLKPAEGKHKQGYAGSGGIGRARPSGPPAVSEIAGLPALAERLPFVARGRPIGRPALAWHRLECRMGRQMVLDPVEIDRIV